MNLFTLRYIRRVLPGWMLLFSFFFTAQAQCPQASFTLPDTVCIGETVNIVNTSTGATRYEWDFCSGDLNKTPVIGNTVNVPSIKSFALGISTISDGENWYSFITTTNFTSHSILRLDYGKDLNSTPLITDLGNPGGLLNNPDQIKIIKIGQEWFGLVGDISGLAGRTLIRLSFGDKLTNTPSATAVESLRGRFAMPRSLDILEDNGNYIVVVVNHLSNSFSIINFGTSLLNEPKVTDVLTTSSVQNAPSGSGLMRVSITKYCNQWIGVAASYNNKLFLLEFGEKLFSVPKITELPNAISSGAFFTSVKLLIDKSDINAIVTQLDTKIVVFNFGNSLGNKPVIHNLFDYKATELGGPDIINDNSSTILLGIRYVEKQLVQINIDNCSASSSQSIIPNPINLTYNGQGKQIISIAAYNSNNDVSYFTDSLYVRPAITSTFSASNQCINQPVTFKSTGVVAGNRAVSYTWNFGDGNSATGASVQHTFTQAKSYNVSLTVTDICGKILTTTQVVQIYNTSTPDFTIPAVVCSNQPIAFMDASLVGDDTIVKWEWNFGGETRNEQNPTYMFTQAGMQTVSLSITGKSGCQTNILKTISIKEGAKVEFAVAQTCLGLQTQFKDETVLGTGTTMVSRKWDFGDNTTSTDPNPTHNYNQPGQYTVKLTIQNNIGCDVTKIQTITIRRLPQAVFSNALACAGEGTQFTDASTITDGTITQWLWSFGDAGSSANVSTASNPVHVFSTPGTYQVKLKVITNYGCADSVMKAVTVLTAPKADFSFQSSCSSREVAFTDISQTGNSTITAYYWEFGDNTTPSTEKSPKHTYASEGAYTVRLTVTSASRCTNTIEKTVASGGVAVTFTPDTAICAVGSVSFTPQVISTNDPVKSWQWDFGSLGSFTVETPTVIIPGSFTSLSARLTVTTVSGCSATFSKTIPIRQAAIAQFGYQVPATNPLTVTFTNQSINAKNYVWDFGDNTTSTDPNPSHTYNQPGIYEVVLKAIHVNGCETTLSKTLPLAIATGNQINVFPNPIVNGKNATLGFVLSRKQSVYIELFDLAGRSLQKTLFDNTKDNFNAVNLQEVLPIISSVCQGVYIITLRFENTLQAQKVIVQ